MDPEYDDLLIPVQSHWKAASDVMIRLGDLQDPHWYQPSDAPRSIMHAYVRCSPTLAGALHHRCDESCASHRVRVCVLKRRTLPTAYAELTRRAS